MPVFLSEVPQLFRAGVLPLDLALIQVSPAAHYRNILGRQATRNYSIAAPVFGDPTRTPFRKLATPVDYVESFLDQQAVLLQFITDAFAGGAPKIDWTIAPVDPKE